MSKPVTRNDLGLAFRKAMLQTDPEDDENNRAGAAFLAVLDDLDIIPRYELRDSSGRVPAVTYRLEWKDV